MRKNILILISFLFLSYGVFAQAPDCSGALQICSGSSPTPSVTASTGSSNELVYSTTAGCLSSEHGSNWYWINVTSTGTVAFSALGLNSSGTSADIDGAIWGPFTSVSNGCSALTTSPGLAPLRCSFAATYGITLVNGAGDSTEGSGGNGNVEDIDITSSSQFGVYLIYIDNFNAGSSTGAVSMTFNYTGTAAIPCPSACLTCGTADNCSASTIFADFTTEEANGNQGCNPGQIQPMTNPGTVTFCHQFTTPASMTSTRVAFGAEVSRPNTCAISFTSESIQPAGCGTALTPGGIDAASGFSWYTLAPNTTYNYCMTWSWNDVDCVGQVENPCVRPFYSPAPLPNDACANATPLVCGAAALAGTTVNSTSETAPGACGSPYGVWYTFTGDGGSNTITTTPQSGFDVEMDIFSASACGGPYTTIKCDDDGGSGTAETHTFATTNGQLYFVYVTYYATSGTSTNVGTFTIGMTCLPPAYNADGSTTNGGIAVCTGAPNPIITLTGATGVLRDPGGTGNYLSCSSGTCSRSVVICPGGNDGGTVTIDFSVMDTETGYDGVAIYNGPSTLYPEFTTGTGYDATIGTSGSTYSGYSGQYTTGDIGPTSNGVFTSTNSTGCLTVEFITDASGVDTGFELSWTSTGGGNPIPAGDECSNAILAGSTPQPGNNIGYISNCNENPYYSTGGTPSSCASSNENTIWYKFISDGDGGAITSELTSHSTLPSGAGDTGYTLGTQFTIMSAGTVPGSCSSLNWVTCTGASTGTTLSNTFTATPNTVYYLRVDGNAGDEASWNISIQGPGAAPVGMVYFKGETNNGINYLTWQTNSEINNAFFIVERSFDGIRFDEIGRVEGKINSSSLQNYSFDDNDPFFLSYYRLTQVDINGQFEISKIIRLSRDNKQPVTITNIVPNPVSGDRITFTVDASQRCKSMINVFDISGKLIMNNINQLNAGENNIDLDVTDLLRGVYFLEIVDNTTGFKSIEKFVKN